MVLTQGLDTGPVLLQRECDVLEDDTLDSLYKRFMYPEGIKATVNLPNFGIIKVNALELGTLTSHRCLFFVYCDRSVFDLSSPSLKGSKIVFRDEANSFQ